MKHPTGSGFQFEGVKSLLDLESHNNVRMVGIYHDSDEIDIKNFVGVLYNEIRDQYDAASFLARVGEKSAESNWGLENLQKTLLSEMGEEVTKRGSIYNGSSEIKQKLGSKKILLILDDVDNIRQLEALAGGGNWFGPGSRVIVTTRDKDVLDNYEPEDDLEMRICCIGEGEIEGNVKEGYANVVGLVEDFEIVINQLKDEDSSENVVSIVGMGGLGKTTLARKIYNDEEVKKLFPCRAWAIVSKDCREKEVCKSLLNCLKMSTSKHEDSSSEEKLKQMVKKCLKGKKYLVVLDDVWDTKAWATLKGCFPNNSGGMVLITTRNDQVAYFSRSKEPHHRLSFMDEEESWKLFCNEVFGGEECPPYLEPLGRSIAQSCKGLPLAIKTTAGIVAKRERSEDTWKEMMNLLPYWCVAEDKDGSEVMMEILKFSLDDLPRKLKPCFLYLGIYPEDEEIRVRDLIHMWIAEGFIETIQIGRSKVPQLEPEDIGEQYLKELVDRNLVQVRSRRSDGKGVKTCQIHDLIRELCISESKNPDNNNNARRLSFLSSIGSYACSVETCNEARTRSLFFYGDAHGWSQHIPENCQLNVLYFKQQVKGSSSDEYLENLTPLRYLRMEVDTYRLSNFRSVETLQVLGSWLSKSLRIGEFKQLRHMHSKFWVSLLVDKAQGVKDKMQNLQTLCYVLLNSQLGFLLDNGCFPSLRTLGVLQNGDSRSSVEENLRSLHRLSNLHKLKLKYIHFKQVRLDRIPFPSNLTKITLSSFEFFKSKDMNTLGLIPRLQILKLVDGDFTEKTLNCGAAGSFPQLQVFIMIAVDVMYLTSEEGAMARLQRAVIYECPQLVEVPKQMHSLGSNFEYDDDDDDEDDEDDDCYDDDDDEDDDDDHDFDDFDDE
ncbi:putative disease resistance RPP13-like protein 3 [Arachis duranensis]|uniref:Disease resistance RPP13-like protein 3 n=1 Tax=Arachis duranensis TaxID=130453 RepID=A0A9C6TTJ6_ARADU|nr:putative disease resistance RPP13-like protein 3 [Arachis duranensis]